jgi:serine O-acetyltransferase
MWERIKEDIDVIFEKDPASRNVLEILACYPGFHALIIHRIAHALWCYNLKLAARMVSHIGRFLTGIEIHPGARIGRKFFIDHGMGVVIGETAEIGDNVILYHGVTLGSTSWKRVKRHPTIGNDVIVGAGAKILGAITVGDGSVIGSGSVVVKPVPPHSTVVGIPGRVVYKDGKKITGLDGIDSSELPDPVAQAIKCILDRMYEMEKEITVLNEKQKGGKVLVEEEIPCPKRRELKEEGRRMLENFIDGGGI